MRVRTSEYELIATQEGKYYLVVLYDGGKQKSKTNNDTNEEGK